MVMEHIQQLDLQDFLTSTLTVYIKDLGTERDTVESYISLFNTIEDYKEKVSRKVFLKLLSDVQNVLLNDNSIKYRKGAGEFLLDIIKLRSTIEFIIGRWNDYYLSIKDYLEKNPYQKVTIEHNENPFIFYLHFDNDNDEFGDCIEILSNRDLLVGDFLDFSDHEILENVEHVYNTPIFKIVKRMYSVEFGEMNLHLVPFND